MLRSLLRPALALLFLTACREAHAHNPGLSSAKITLEEQGISAQLAFNPKDLAPLLEDEGLTTPALDALARRALALSIDGAPLAPPRVTVRTGESNDTELHISFPRSGGTELTIRSALLGDMASGHRQIVEVRTTRGGLVGSALLSAGNASLSIALPAGGSGEEASPHTFVDFLKLGIEHILAGYDHLLFLFGLLLVCDRFGPAVRIITAFTVAHSISLAAATFNLVNLSPRIVEPLIAASIIYVGVENLVRGREVKGRTALTFAFGLVHGLGFAGVLREVGVGAGGSGVAVPLASFNLGVETGQLAVAAVLLPIIWQLRKQPAFLRVGAPALSLLIVLAGTYWLLERTFGA